ncbi:hypothetical protein ABE10_01455, partial [Bacillus toyonensis]|nr:hypothetical protein [Bacillus toyonensis]
MVDHGAVHREGSLHAHLEADLADGEGLADTVALAADDDALEDLDARTSALGDVHVHLDGVTGEELGDVGTERSRVDGVEDLHDRLSLHSPQVGCNYWKEQDVIGAVRRRARPWAPLRQSRSRHKGQFCHGSRSAQKRGAQ